MSPLISVSGTRRSGNPLAQISLTPDDATVTVAQDGVAYIELTLTREHFWGDVTLSVTGLPTGVTGEFSDATLSGGDTTSTLTLTAADDAPTISADAFQIVGSSSGVSDATVDGTVTVEAAGVAPFFTEDFADGVVHETGGWNWSTPNFYPTVGPTPYPYREITDELSHSGTHSMVWKFGPDPLLTNGWQNGTWTYSMGRTVTELWMELYFYISENYVHRSNEPVTSNNDKFFALYRDSYSDGQNCLVVGGFGRYGDMGDVSKCKNVATLWSTQNQYTISDVHNAAFAGGAGPVVPGQWNRIRFHIKPSSDDSTRDGIWQFQANDTTIENWDNLPMYDETGSGNEFPAWNAGYFLGVSNAGYTEETKFYIDDLKFYDEDPGWEFGTPDSFPIF